MTDIRVFCLFFVGMVAVPANGQECSGGQGGGMDATGNQCSNPALNDPESGIVARTRSSPPAIGGRSASEGTFRISPAAPTRGAQLRLTAAKLGDGRVPVKTVPLGVPLHTAKIADVHEATCSGGADGGMDATGNQCALSTPSLTHLEHRDTR